MIRLQRKATNPVPYAKKESYILELYSTVSEKIRKTKQYFLNTQDKEGFWWYELHSNVTITAEYLMLLHFLGIDEPKKTEKIVNHIRKCQRDDGTWAIHEDGKGDLSTTVEAYFALKLAGIDMDEPYMEKARTFILANGGVEASRVFTKIFLALFNQYKWNSVPSIPPEIMHLPLWFPFNIYNFSSWARATFVPLLVVFDAKPSVSLPDEKRIVELYKNPGRKRYPLTDLKPPFFTWQRFFLFTDRLIKIYEKIRIRPFRQKGIDKAVRWIFDHQEKSGDWGGIQPAMVNSMLALSTLGYNLSDTPLRNGLEAIDRFAIEKKNEFILQSCISPVWDTALTALALLNSGVDVEDNSVVRACKWLLPRQIMQKGDWSIKRPDLEPGGWAFEFDNNFYPDIDDTAVVLMFLFKYFDFDFVDTTKLAKGVNWVLGMQNKDGGWGAFDTENNTTLLNKMPFGDLEAMIDPSTPDITGRMLELLGYINYSINDVQVQKAISYVKNNQEKDGSWWGRWGVNYIYGTWSVLEGLQSIGEDLNKPYVKKAAKWLVEHQNSDGGWGESCESYCDTELSGQGQSTPSQTGWALMGLIAANEGLSLSAFRGVQYLLDTQQSDGTWNEKVFTGTGFPKHFMLWYENYRNCFPLMALGKFLQQRQL